MSIFYKDKNKYEIDAKSSSKTVLKFFNYLRSVKLFFIILFLNSYENLIV